MFFFANPINQKIPNYDHCGGYPTRDGQKLIALQLIAFIALQLSIFKGRNIAIINCNGRN